MVQSLVVRGLGLEYGGREFESRSMHLKLGGVGAQMIASNLVISDCASAISVKIETTTTQ